MSQQAPMNPHSLPALQTSHSKQVRRAPMGNLRLQPVIMKLRLHESVCTEYARRNTTNASQGASASNFAKTRLALPPIHTNGVLVALESTI